MGLLNKRQKHLKRAREQKQQKGQSRAIFFAEIERKRQQRLNRRARELEREESRLAAEQLQSESLSNRVAETTNEHTQVDASPPDELKDSVLEARRL